MSRVIVEAYDSAQRATALDDRDGLHPIRCARRHQSGASSSIHGPWRAGQFHPSRFPRRCPLALPRRNLHVCPVTRALRHQVLPVTATNLRRAAVTSLRLGPRLLPWNRSPSPGMPVSHPPRRYAAAAVFPDGEVEVTHQVTHDSADTCPHLLWAWARE